MDTRKWTVAGLLTAFVGLAVLSGAEVDEGGETSVWVGVKVDDEEYEACAVYIQPKHTQQNMWCEAPETPVNGGYEITTADVKNTNNTRHIIRYHCHTGYNLVGRQANRTCNETSKRWITHEPYCEPKYINQFKHKWITTENKVNDIESKMMTVVNKVADIEKKLTATVSTVNDIDNKLITSINKVSDMDSKMTTSIIKVNGIDNKVTTTVRKVNDIDIKVINSINKLNGIDNNIATMVSKVNYIESEMLASMNKVNEIDNKMTTSINTVDDIENMLTTTLSKVNDIDSKMTTSIDKVYEIDNKLTTSINTFNDFVKKLTTTVGKVADIDDRLTAYASSEKNTDDRITTTINSLASIDNKLTALEAKQTTVDNRMKTANILTSMAFLASEFQSERERLSKDGELAKVGFKYGSVVYQFTWLVKNMEEEIAKAEDRGHDYIDSQSFYTNVPGYRIKLQLDANDRNSGYVGLYLRLVKGEFDDIVSWPFINLFELTSVDRDGEPTASIVINPPYEKGCPNAFLKPPKNKVGCGNAKYMKIETLLSNKDRYLIDGSLIIRFTYRLIN